MDRRDFLEDIFNTYAGEYVVEFLKNKVIKLNNNFMTKEDIAQEILMKLAENLDKFDYKSEKEFKPELFKEFCMKTFNENYHEVAKFARKSNLSMNDVQRF